MTVPDFGTYPEDDDDDYWDFEYWDIPPHEMKEDDNDRDS